MKYDFDFKNGSLQDFDALPDVAKKLLMPTMLKKAGLAVLLVIAQVTAMICSIFYSFGLLAVWPHALVAVATLVILIVVTFLLKMVRNYFYTQFELHIFSKENNAL